MKKFLRWFLIVVVVLVIAYLAGPHPSAPAYKKELPAVPAAPAALESYIQAGEAQHKLKPDNQARIVWANDSMHHKTPYAIVYLHGSPAPQPQGNPVHPNIAKKFGCNLYLSRLSQHGLDTTEPMMNLTADNYWESAGQALAEQELVPAVVGLWLPNLLFALLGLYLFTQVAGERTVLKLERLQSAVDMLRSRLRLRTEASS